MLLLLLVGVVVLFASTLSGIGKGIVSSVAGSGPAPPVPPTPGAPAVNNSDESLTGSYITSDPATYPGATFLYPNDKVWNICTAVAMAEGYNLGTGSAPYDLNNPGDLSPGDENGQATIGSGEYHGGSTIIHFATCEGGFIALYDKFNRIVSGGSSVFPANWTWTQVAAKYAGNWQSWLNNVTGYLGVDPNSTPAQYVNP